MLTLSWLLLPLLAAATPAPSSPPAADRPRNVILLVSDGCGFASFELARAVAGRPLVLDSVRTGRVRTASVNQRVTDSAAGATAYAAGVRTVNRRLGRDATGAPLTSWFLEAARGGRATGLVATTDITDATPAAFVAHVHDRGSQDSVAVQLLTARPEVVLGGGRDWWLPEPAGRRQDGRDLLAEAERAGYRLVRDPAALDGDDTAACLGLFAGGSLEFTLDRDPAAQPTLLAMARAALRRLARDPGGFVLMVEGSRIDHAAHRNDPAAHAREVLEYEAMAAEMLAFARRDGRTLVVAVSDHETGGLAFAPPRVQDGLDTAPLLAQRASSFRMADAIARTGQVDSVLAADWDGGHLTPQERKRLAHASQVGDRARVLASAASRRARVRWSTDGHTGQDVPLFAFGPGASEFRGTLDNAEVGRRIARLLGVANGYTTAR